ncbi:acyl-ACP desaturase [Haliscomenobacter hydrossis]|uniref:Acyl-(Acyl-carrier-protein) desaturase n=1 Tax=Haliscomenobacter hydrossis (strain ATCC 27775 / DSM 1100 / LMG 10767 / O) TaxID=760192 RepID=F4KSI4_HALH1|nr:acyl-ACP desaturase [Haliscomenobacter hydrossis]AEE54335.1 Acyl-(acyl-carrier-protein) desaturase [Haliscomenobacter hydrossis DSM 1100]
MATPQIPSLSNEVSKNLEVITQIEPFVRTAIETLLVDVNTCWQPTDFLPDMSKEDALDQVHQLRERAAGIPDEVIVSLIGNMITEEALPSYQTYFNLLDGINREHSVTSENAWVTWSRQWTSEENRHGDLLNKYLYLSGRADMRQVEVTIQTLISNGFDANTDNDPYQAMIYTSFQERATKISHNNTGKLASKAGDNVLSRICTTIAGDEGRHERAYKTFMREIFDIDPNGAMLAFEKMMRKQIAMPALLIDKGNDRNMFARFSAITQKIGIYTTWDYAKIIEHLVEFWKIENVTGLTGAAAKAQVYLSKLPERYLRIAERVKAPEEISLVWLSC